MLEVISEPTCLDTNCCFKWALQRFFVTAIAGLEGKRHSANRADPRGKSWLTRLEQLKLTRRWEGLHGHKRVTPVKINSVHRDIDIEFLLQRADLDKKAPTNGSKSGLTLSGRRFANTWIRTAGCLNGLDKTKQSKTGPQEHESELISLAMPPLLHSQQKQWRQQWAEAKSSNMWFYIVDMQLRMLKTLISRVSA